MATYPTFRKGNTFAFTFSYTDAAGVAIPISPTEVRAQVRRRNGTLVATLSAAAGEASNQIDFTCASSTRSWPVETLIMDIVVTKDSVVRSTETILIPVEDEITQPV